MRLNAHQEGRCFGCWALLDEATATTRRLPLLTDVVHFWLLRKQLLLLQLLPKKGPATANVRIHHCSPPPDDVTYVTKGFLSTATSTTNRPTNHHVERSRLTTTSITIWLILVLVFLAAFQNDEEGSDMPDVKDGRQCNEPKKRLACSFS